MHTIRLRGAWVTAHDGDHSRHSRPFGWPTTLDPNERVWVVCAISGPVAVSLNGTALGDSPAGGVLFAADVTLLLRPRNEIVLITPVDLPPAQVWLEVRRADSALA